MSTTTLYRVEHPQSRRGPYTDSKRWDRLKGQEDLLIMLTEAIQPSTDGWIEAHPPPHVDGLDDRLMSSHEQCAFASIDQMLQWWPELETYEILEAAGYRLHEIEVHADKVTHLKHQSIFDSGAVLSRKVLDSLTVLL
jgi:hypothetical protein